MTGPSAVSPAAFPSSGTSCTSRIASGGNAANPSKVGAAPAACASAPVVPKACRGVKKPAGDALGDRPAEQPTGGRRVQQDGDRARLSWVAVAITFEVIDRPPRGQYRCRTTNSNRFVVATFAALTEISKKTAFRVVPGQPSAQTPARLPT